MTRTPSDRRTVERLASEGTPAEAVRKAWTDPGSHPEWHRRMTVEVRRSMPVLAAALDRLAAEG